MFNRCTIDSIKNFVQIFSSFFTNKCTKIKEFKDKPSIFKPPERKNSNKKLDFILYF